MAVVTLTLDLPEDLANELMLLPEAERNRRAAKVLIESKAEIATDSDEESDDLPPLSPEDLESVGRGLADADAGRFVDPETVYAKLRKQVGL